MTEGRQQVTGFQIGLHPTKVDAKGRCGLPQSLRRHYGDYVVALKLKDRIKVMSPELFETLAQALNNRYSFDDELSLHNFFSGDIQSLLSYFFGNSYELAFDGQGRLTIPSVVRERLGLVENVAWRGCGSHVELLPGSFEEVDRARLEKEGDIERIIIALLAPTPPSAQSSTSGAEEGAGRKDG
jgi:DNA-binding transcriptional regulator/RsmH inhibitor MraZ